MQAKKIRLKCSAGAPLLACMFLLGSGLNHAVAEDGEYHWTRAELKNQTNLVVKRLKIMPAGVPPATAVLVCPGVIASGTSKSECLLEEDGYWRAYYQLDVPPETWRVAAKVPQAVVFVLHTSKAFTHFLRSNSWTAHGDQTLSGADFSVLLVTPNQIEAVPTLEGAKLKKIMM